ncbi:cupin domain-containing protein [Streptomyces tailanensis]|uniref:cupin domain-containing protein n=1 Tax=Streptomyces tailanensis TaxID=2569858 RepID=UPI00122DEE1B|nr:cupin domain-containing protein [Streptomyces tailanensis]
MSELSRKAVVVKEDEAEKVTFPSAVARLLVDATGVGGALSCHHVQLSMGADGSSPHYHAKSSELFYVIDGSLQMLLEDEVVTAEKGSLVVVPPGMPHCFAAPPQDLAEVLIVLTPGIERFGYFHLLKEVIEGGATADDLAAAEGLYDSHSVDSPVWRATRAR